MGHTSGVTSDVHTQVW